MDDYIYIFFWDGESIIQCGHLITIKIGNFEKSMENFLLLLLLLLWINF